MLFQKKKSVLLTISIVVIMSLAGYLFGCQSTGTGNNEYKPGTYTTRQQGHNGSIDVEVTFSKTAITAIKVVKSYETPGVSDKSILTDLPQAIIARQSLSVDTITG